MQISLKEGVRIKKLSCVLLALMMLLCMSSCKNNRSTDTTTADDTAPQKHETIAPVETSGQTTDDTTSVEETTQAAETHIKSDKYEENVYFEPETYDSRWNLAPLDRQIMANDENWVLTGKDLYHDGYAGSDIHGSVFTLLNKNYIGEYDTYKLDFSLNTPESDDERDRAKEKALFAGLRRQMTDTDTEDGIWIGFKDESLYIKGGGDLSESLTEITLPCGFGSDFRRVYIEDIQSQEVIKVYLGNDDGKKQLVCKLYIGKNDTKQVTYMDVYTWQDSFNSKVTTVELSAEMYNGGCVMLWNSGRGKTYIKDVAFKIS